MATTTTAFTGCDYGWELDNAAGTVQNIQGSITSVDASLENKVGTFKVFGTQWENAIQCGKKVSIKVKGIATTATNETRDILLNWYFGGSGNRTFTWYEPSNASGNKKFTGEFALKSVKVSPDSSDEKPVFYEFELIPDGAVVMSTVP